VADGAARETGLLLWGEAAAGRTHLLRAVATAARAHRPALYLPQWQEVPAEPPGPHALVAADDVDGADTAAQGRLFTLYNRLRETGGHLVTATAGPPTRLRLREDLRTRLGWGLVYEVLPLTDVDKPAALARYARERGFLLPDDVIAHLLTYGRRDMRSLVATLGALDRLSLVHKRPITVPLLRAWLQRERAAPDAG
jgi:DnaA family protein